MANLHEQLLTAIAESNLVEVKRLIRGEVDLNVRCDQGASVLYDVDGRVESESDFEARERRASEWQSSKAAR